jgi:CRP-like cAMP-binding protein
MKKISDILSGIPSFSGLSEKRIEELQKIVINRHFNKGQLLFSEGDNGDGFYVVISGLVKIFKVSTEGKEHIMRVVGPGELHVENLALKEVPGRLAAYLIYLSDEQGGNDSVTLGISKGQLASLLSTTPETLSRILAQMAANNLVEVMRRDITILDLEGLKELAEHGKSIA